MSFLSSVLSSIETGQSHSINPSPPPRFPGHQNLPDDAKREIQKFTPSVAERTTIPVRNENTSAVGVKRKADEALSPQERSKTRPISKVLSSSKGVPSTATTRPTRPPGSAIKSPRLDTKSLPTNGTAAPKPSVSMTSSKPPPKGSFADLMMKAKAVQEQKPMQVGLLKHQAVPKEKLSKAEKKKRAMEAIAKEKAARLEKRGSASSKPAVVKTTAKSETAVAKRREQEVNTYKGTSRPTPSTYKGTANIPLRRSNADRHGRSDSQRNRRPKRDEYLGTDEEDEGDFLGDDYDDFYSDESSDMEAGLEEVEREEEATLRVARREDEEDVRAEFAAKKEKIERKRKLTILAAKSKR